ncbi:ADP-dependent (S)-NAD(P)H-hydrate dehydratase [Skermanella aerolata]|uniref:ADP-dependent (S)-NAD(P)H-hydrate dehydratase n=1 Tax=Skermanella aerolata TaxID=393310 RepID=A0A512DSU8_9PROT|nr:NAD(P)H-hydrate dehydratase [Skermanella aerolata]KJB96045.1 carbohydrate kinase [Skermanella aerolata KACC 11604]GEO39516.1 ADP-dependent (S)-NAD(P)H-hydrate dehydratase [Skermanella aerolata]
MMDATRITPELLRAMPLPQPAGSTDKNARGSVLIVAGSVEVPGAALLAGTAALRAGAGKLQIATCSSIAPHLGLAVPEALVLGLPETSAGGVDPDAAELLCERAKRSDAVLLGPGMMDKEAVAELTTGMVKDLSGPALVLDAEALVCLDTLRDPLCEREGRTIITPHAGEMASLLEIEREAVEADPFAVANEVARRFRMVVALKGATTYIAAPDGECWFYESGNVGLATSGSGDTLAGVVTGLVARGASPAQAAVWGVYLHGQAGNRLARSLGPMGFLARELLAEIPGVMAELAH